MARTLPPVLRTSLAWERLEVDMLCEAGSNPVGLGKIGRASVCLKLGQ